MARPLNYDKSILCRISTKENLDLVNIAKNAGVTKSDILRMAIKSLKDSIKKTNSDIKKKAEMIKSKGRTPTIKELWGVDSGLIEKKLNNGLYEKIIENKDKKK